MHFVNAVAAEIEKEFPGFLVETLADDAIPAEVTAARCGGAMNPCDLAR